MRPPANTRARALWTGIVLFLALALVGVIYRANEIDDTYGSWEYHSGNITTIRYRDGVVCYLHEGWRQMSCVVNDRTYGPKEF